MRANTVMEDDKKNINFVQFDRGVMKAHRELILKNSLAAAILDIFIEYMGKNNAIVCSVKALEELTGRKRTSVSTALSILKKDNWIQAIKVGNANAYVVNSAGFWTTWANGKNYSLFHASVLAAASEQDKTLENLKKIDLKKLPIIYDKEEIIIMGSEELTPPDQKDIDLN